MTAAQIIIDPGCVSQAYITELEFIGPATDDEYNARVRGRLRWFGVDFVFVRGFFNELQLLDATGHEMELIQNDGLDHEYYKPEDDDVLVAYEAVNGLLGVLEARLGVIESDADRAAERAYEGEWRTSAAKLVKGGRFEL